MSRPVHLDLTTIHFPITAIVSILHRISGVLLAVGLVYALYVASISLASQAGFDAVLGFAADPIHKFAMWIVLTATIYHVIAGIRHLALDLHLGDDLAPARISAWLTLVSSVTLSILAAWWLWMRL